MSTFTGEEISNSTRRPAVYTVSFAKSSVASFEVSRYFNTKKAALRWARWIASTSFTFAVKVHRGQAGGELVAELAGAQS